jgi:hypothetical protein
MLQAQPGIARSYEGQSASKMVLFVHGGTVAHHTVQREPKKQQGAQNWYD